MKTRIRVVFTGLKKDCPNWPHINYNVEKRADEVMAMLRSQLPDIDFTHAVYYSREEAEQGYASSEKGEYDGWLIYLTTLMTMIPVFYAEHVHPVVIADEMYSGSGEFLGVRAQIEKQNLPVATVSSSDFGDVVDTVRLLDVMAKMRRSRVLVIANSKKSWGADPAKVEAAKQIFGTDVVFKTGQDLRQAYAATTDSDARPQCDQWIGEAQAVVEPDEKELLRSARMYSALKELMAQTQADAVTVDCLGLFYSGEADAYPCLSFFQLNNDGITGVCEGDLNSTLAQLLFRHLSGQPAYVSDPVIDEAVGQIIYAHCVATNRVAGPLGAPCPYVIRSHAEDLKGASVQTLLPLGQTVTTAALSGPNRAMALHTARTVANVNEERACRTKLAAEVDTDLLLSNYHADLFGWHQVTCYGNHRRAMKQLARLYGLRCIEQDR